MKRVIKRSNSLTHNVRNQARIGTASVIHISLECEA